MRLRKTFITAAVASAVLAGIASASAMPAKGGEGHGDGVTAETRVLAALERDLGLTADQARQLGARQAEAIALDAELQQELGKAYTGSVFDPATGKLTVMVSQRSALATARAEGAGAKLVEHSRAELVKIRAALDAASGRVEGATAVHRKASGAAKAAAASLSSWYVDAATGTVRVTAVKGQLGKAEKALATYGDAVSVVEGAAPAIPADRYFDGGDGYNGNSCSVGINVRNKSTGQGYMITAGHCVSTGSTAYGHDGTKFGTVLEKWFPTYDDAIVRNDSAGYWIQGPWVDTAPSHGSVISFAGYTDGPVGTTVCKSGIKTGYTCGQITAKDESVTYSSGTVYGLTRHSACVEKGDSGGANVSASFNWWTWTWSYAAEGVTSGAQLWTKDGALRCGAAVGQPNVSWYFPIADSLAYYGPKYGVSVW